MRTKWMVFLVLLALLCLAVAVRADAPGFSIDWYVVSGGGGRSTGGAFVLDGSVLQAGGVTSGGHYQLQSGFWYGVSGVAFTPSHWLHLPVLLRNWTAP
ncbi:MAG: hypothetical protein H5T63_08870 [Chloroflexi bacterium]|nr:hypothetical protein [Chloroflexota bacterium]